MTTVAFIGLGVMGAPMAGHLASAGHDVRVYNRSAPKAQQWAGEHRGVVTANSAAAATGAHAVFVCVGNDDDVRHVVLGREGVLAALERGAIIVDHTTASATLARELSSLAAARGVGFIDAPVSGGQAGAVNGTLTIMCGGDQATFDSVAPLMAAYSNACTLLGPSGSGQLTKMVNQIAIAGLLQGLAEALDFGRRAGLDRETVIDVIGKGAAGSWQLENRGPTMVRAEFDFGFAVQWMRKDLGICIDEAHGNGASLAITKLIDRYYAEIVEMGGARWDTSSLIRRLS
ncbi:MAG TPA: NAD(P)-dependent oxidoreductase [Acidimicrobiales bacterium]|nr:NAD(P)-dependent oxidoreductase [Acidimicrobiales bacterium]